MYIGGRAGEGDRGGGKCYHISSPSQQNHANTINGRDVRQTELQYTWTTNCGWSLVHDHRWGRPRPAPVRRGRSITSDRSIHALHVDYITVWFGRVTSEVSKAEAERRAWREWDVRVGLGQLFVGRSRLGRQTKTFRMLETHARVHVHVRSSTDSAAMLHKHTTNCRLTCTQQ